MSEFKAGDKVWCVRASSNSGLVKGRIYTVSNISDDYVYLKDVLRGWCKDRFVKVEDDPKTLADKYRALRIEAQGICEQLIALGYTPIGGDGTVMRPAPSSYYKNARFKKPVTTTEEI